jgi:hypothetical protein
VEAPRTKETRASWITTPEGTAKSAHQLVVDHSERDSALLDALRRSGYFDVQMDRLAAGDYLVNGEVLVERKTIRDLASSPWGHRPGSIATASFTSGAALVGSASTRADCRGAGGGARARINRRLYAGGSDRIDRRQAQEGVTR